MQTQALIELTADELVAVSGGFTLTSTGANNFGVVNGNGSQSLSTALGSQVNINGGGTGATALNLGAFTLVS